MVGDAAKRNVVIIILFNNKLLLLWRIRSAAALLFPYGFLVFSIFRRLADTETVERFLPE